jgi:hypothetical protein
MKANCYTVRNGNVTAGFEVKQWETYKNGRRFPMVKIGEKWLHAYFKNSPEVIDGKIFEAFAVMVRLRRNGEYLYTLAKPHRPPAGSLVLLENTPQYSISGKGRELVKSNNNFLLLLFPGDELRTEKYVFNIKEQPEPTKTTKIRKDQTNR